MRKDIGSKMGARLICEVSLAKTRKIAYGTVRTVTT